MEKTREINSIEEFRDSFVQTKAEMKTGFVLIMRTDELDIQILAQADLDWDVLYRKALEIRVFNKKQEVKWFRSSVDRKFQVRDKKDEQMEEGDYWDEYQYLSIDEKKSRFAEDTAYAIGGGMYRLPLSGSSDVDDDGKKFVDYSDVKIKVRNYLQYNEDNGCVSVADWRLVGFAMDGKER